VLLDATNLSNLDRHRFVRLATAVGATLVAVRLTAPEDVVRERLSYQRTGHSTATFAVYESMRWRAQPFMAPAVVVDTRFALGPSIELAAALAQAQG